MGLGGKSQNGGVLHRDVPSWSEHTCVGWGLDVRVQARPGESPRAGSPNAQAPTRSHPLCECGGRGDVCCDGPSHRVL